MYVGNKTKKGQSFVQKLKATINQVSSAPASVFTGTISFSHSNPSCCWIVTHIPQMWILSLPPDQLYLVSDLELLLFSLSAWRHSVCCDITNWDTTWTSINSARIFSHFTLYIPARALSVVSSLLLLHCNWLRSCLFLLLDSELKGGDSDLFILLYVRSVTVPGSVV